MKVEEMDREHQMSVILGFQNGKQKVVELVAGPGGEFFGENVEGEVQCR